MLRLAVSSSRPERSRGCLTWVVLTTRSFESNLWKAQARGGARLKRDLIAVVESRVPRGPVDDDGGHQCDSVLIQVLLDPAQKLRNTINLIVVPSIWKTKQLIEKVVQPGGVSRQMDLAGFDLR